MFEGGIRTPSFIYAPGIVAPGATDAVTRIVDVGPTLLGLVGATVRGLDGRDVRSDWEQPSSTEDLVLFYDKAARCGAAVPRPVQVRPERRLPLRGRAARRLAGRRRRRRKIHLASAQASSASSIWTKDPAERADVGNSHPAVLAALRALLFDAEIDSAPSRVLETPGDPAADPRREVGPRRAVGELVGFVSCLRIKFCCV